VIRDTDIEVLAPASVKLVVLSCLVYADCDLWHSLQIQCANHIFFTTLKNGVQNLRQIQNNGTDILLQKCIQTRIKKIKNTIHTVDNAG